MNQGNGGWDPGLYDSTHNYVFNHGRGLVDLLAPRSGERILDLGCGTGHLTYQIAESGAQVVGIDSSPAMIAQARQNYPKLKFHLVSAVDFDGAFQFDAVFSNAVLHWIQPPENAVLAIARALRPGGRLVAEFGGRGNIASVVKSVGRNPWYFPGIVEYAGLLERHGFDVQSAALYDRPTRVEGPDGMRDWLTMFFQPSPGDAEIERVSNELRPLLFRDGDWYIDYRRLRIVAQTALSVA